MKHFQNLHFEKSSRAPEVNVLKQKEEKGVLTSNDGNNMRRNEEKRKQVWGYSMKTESREKKPNRCWNEIMENNSNSQEIFGWDHPCASWEHFSVSLILLPQDPALPLSCHQMCQERMAELLTGPCRHLSATDTKEEGKFCSWSTCTWQVCPSHQYWRSLLQLQQAVCICHLAPNSGSHR